MRVGLVIVTYNAEPYIGRTLEAVAAQTRPPDEVLIVDNASTDGTLATVARATGSWRVPPRVVASAANLGFARANNQAVASLDGCALVALLNPDATPEPAWLAALVAAAEAHPDAGSFASRLMIDGHPDLLDGAGDVCHVSGLIWRHGHGRPVRSVPGALEPRPVFSACAAAALYRTADWARVGGFDERYFCYAEDVDLGFRLQLAGRGCRYVPDAVAHHMGSASAGVGSPFAVYHGHRNLVWTFVKDMPAPLIWRYLPAHVLMTLVAVAWFTLRGRGGAVLRAKRDAVGGLGAMMRARRAVQGARVQPVDRLREQLDRSSLLARWLGLVRPAKG